MTPQRLRHSARRELVTPMVGLSPAEALERGRLREAMRSRKSVDHFARGWYGAMLSLMLTGVLVKLAHDAPAFRWYLVPIALLCAGLWAFAIVHLVRSGRFVRRERVMLGRLQALDARMPKVPELF